MLGLMWAGQQIGMEIPIDLDQVSTYVVALVTAVLQAAWVYWQKNAASVSITEVKVTEVEVPKDSG
jgi:uncharacterized membrane protein